MNNPRIYGDPPYSIALIHGGPGAPGTMMPVAKVLSKYFGVLEPLQTASSIDGQIKELGLLLSKNATPPLILVGHSWGAWLSFIYTAKYPAKIKKLILISSGPFREKYISKLKENRLSHLSDTEKNKLKTLEKLLNNESVKDKSKIFLRFGELMSKADSYDLFPTEDNILEFQQEIFRSVWNEANKLRRNGELIKFGYSIKCPVLAIHGDYDCHPAEGVIKPLSECLTDFHYIILEKCGHEPWREKFARDEFFNIITKELRS
jgi:pimeloyl-ACP methyl ester carboxylesterase